METDDDERYPASEGYTETDDDDAIDTNPNVPWSAAAAFLSSFAPPSPAATDPETIPGYTLGATIGHGGFSVIREAISPAGDTVAVKIVRHARLPATQRTRLSRESRIWSTLSHENILPLFDTFRTPDATFLVTLFCSAGSLFDMLARDGPPHASDVGCIFRQIVKALQYLHHSARLVHGDIKLENVLIDDSGVCRLADFGLTRRIPPDSDSNNNNNSPPSSPSDSDPDAPPSPTKRSTVHLSLLRHRHSAPPPAPAPPLPGSLPYAAPELLQAQLHTKPHPAQDMWALGVLLYTLLTGTFPFRDAFEPRLQMKILRGRYDLPPRLSTHASSILRGCLTPSIPARWTITQVDDSAWGIADLDVSAPLTPIHLAPPSPAPHTHSHASSSPPRSRSHSPVPPRTPSPSPGTNFLSTHATLAHEHEDLALDLDRDLANLALGVSSWTNTHESVFHEDCDELAVSAGDATEKWYTWE